MEDERAAHDAGGTRLALLIVGHCPDERGARATAAVLQLAAMLRGAREPWQVRRLVPDGDCGSVADRLNVKRGLDDLARGAGPAAILVAGGALVRTAEGPALALGADHARYPDEAALSLRWIGECLRARRCERVVVILALVGGAADAGACVQALAVDGAALVTVQVTEDLEAPGSALAAAAAALGGAALDATTGTVTAASLGRWLAAALPDAVLRRRDDHATLVTPPPIGRLDELALALSRRATEPPPPSATLPAPEVIGQVLPGRFRIDAELARGTFGTVYRAHQLSVGRDVAVKILHGDIDLASTDGRLELFLQEIRAVGRIDHPNVVRVHQADISHDGRLFFAMELLAGRTLQELLDGGPLPAPRALALIGQLLAGLGAAHDAGLVHADVKPANAIAVDGRERGTERLVLVDFGLARLRRAGEAADSAGGTPAYMAPEQLHDGRVDERSDVFSAALVLVALLNGWKRRRASELVPPLDGITDEALRAVLARALALAPSERFATAGDLAAALRGEDPARVRAEQRAPFRRLAPFTELDHDRLFGRERELTTLGEHALLRAVTVLTGPSGTGKTSLLRAGLGPRLERLGVQLVYASARLDAVATIIAAIAPGAADLPAAFVRGAGPRRVVIVVDQLEALLGDANDEPVLAALLAFDRWAAPGAPLDCGVVISVREDFLARLLARRELAAASAPVVRLGPIDLAGATNAIVRPLVERRLSIAADLLEKLLADLAAAAASLAPELGWGAAPAVYPPHLQLAGAVLYEALAAGEVELTIAHYRRLGGLEAIIAEHLERVLDSELDAPAAAIARGLFLALVTSSHARAARTEAELVEMTAAARADVLAVLEALRGQGLLVRSTRAAGEPLWELVHDSLVPRIEGWVARHDLARRRAIEQVRYHLRRSRSDAPSLFTRDELRELDAHPGALDELEAEHARRGGEAPWTPSALVARSRRVARRTTAAALALGATVAMVIGVAIYDRWSSAEAERREQLLRDRDLGRFVLALEPFTWDDAGATAAVAPYELPALSWTLHEPDPDDLDQPGAAVPADRVSDAPSLYRPGVFHVEASGGPAFLVVTGRARLGETACAPSVIPLRSLPGYARRAGPPPTLTIRVPTCGATRAAMVTIPAGPFLEGGIGAPPSQVQAAYGVQERETSLPEFAIDRTEVTNRAYAMLASMVAITGLPSPIYPDSNELARSGEPMRPVAGITWGEARAYCRFLGKRLLTSAEWQKATRGGLTLADSIVNPYPRRNLPWGLDVDPKRANVNDGIDTGPAPVGSFPGDVSPYGVLDLGGNVSEWTSTQDVPGFYFVRGGEWATTKPETLVDYAAITNPRPIGDRDFAQGTRCAAD